MTQYFLILCTTKIIFKVQLNVDWNLLLLYEI